MSEKLTRYKAGFRDADGWDGGGSSSIPTLVADPQGSAYLASDADAAIQRLEREKVLLAKLEADWESLTDEEHAEAIGILQATLAAERNRKALNVPVPEETT